MSISNGTSTICAFCYKTTSTSSFENDFKEDNIPDESAHITLLNRFIRLVNRFENGKAAELIEGESFINFISAKCLSCCKDCIVFINKFCDEYHQLKCLELQLEWRLETLVNVMKLAGGLPSSVSKLQKTFERPVTQMPNYCQDTITLANFKSYRQKFINKCTRRLLQSQPRVAIKRIPQDDDNNKLCSEEYHNTALLLPSDEVEETRDSSVEMDYFPNAQDKLDDMTEENFEINLENIDELSQLASCDVLDHYVSYFGSASLISQDLQYGMTSQEPGPVNKVTNGTKSGTNASPTDGLENHVIGTISEHFNSDGNILSTSPTQSETIKYLNLEQDKDDPDSLPSNHVEGKIPQDSEKQIPTDVVHALHKKKRHSQRSTISKVTGCNKYVSGQHQLRRHILLNYNRNRDNHPAKCCKCEKTFVNKYRLNFHMRTVHVKRMHKCAECGKAFKIKCHLQSHAKVHRKNPNWWNFQCPTFPCGDRFRWKVELLEHLKTVHNIGHGCGNYKCSECGKSFTKKENLACHRIIHKNPNEWKYKCPDCGKMFYSRQNMVTHRSTHSTGAKLPVSQTNSYQATIDNSNEEMEKNFSLPSSATDPEPVSSLESENIKKNGGELEDKEVVSTMESSAILVHKIETETVEGSLDMISIVKVESLSQSEKDGDEAVNNQKAKVDENVDTIPVTSSEKASVITEDGEIRKGTLGEGTPQMKLVQDIRPIDPPCKYKCPECGTIRPSKTSLTRHMVQHASPETWQFVCSNCEKRFPYKTMFDRHMSQTLGKFQCSKCPSKFCQKGKLREHIKSHTTPTTCPECGKKRPSKASLARHMLQHESAETWKFACTNCDKRFPYKKRLARHILRTREKFKCSKCPLKFCQKEKLTDHIKSHRTDINYTNTTCTECGEILTSKTYLNRHIIIKHSNPSTWKFTCDKCGLKFPYKHFMNRHTKRHHRFQCSLCAVVFESKDFLDRHSKVFHPKELTCQICQKLFFLKHDLSSHMKAVHQLIVFSNDET